MQVPMLITPHHRSPSCSNTTAVDSTYTSASSIEKRISRKLRLRLKLNSEEGWKSGTVLSRSGKVSGATRYQLSTHVNCATVHHLIEANKLIKYIILNEPLVILFPKLNPNSLHLTLYCDASYNNLPDGGSQGGHIVFLCDDDDNCCPIAWSFSRIKRVIHSTLAAETLSMTEGTGTAFYVLNLLSGILECNQTIHVFADNKSLYETTHSKKPCTDRDCEEIVKYDHLHNVLIMSRDSSIG